MSDVTLRPFRGREDYAGIASVRNRQIDFAGEGVYTTVEHVAEVFDHLQRCDPSTDVIVAEDVHGATVGYAHTTWNHVAEGYREYSLRFDVDGTTEPDPDLEEMILDWVESRALAIAATHPSGDKRLSTHAKLGTPRQRRLEARGFTPILYNVLMLRPLSDPAPAAPLPAPLVSRHVEQDDLRAIWEADIEAFRDAHGYVEQNEVDFERFRAEAAQGTELWHVAWDGNVVVSQVRTRVNPGEAERIGQRRAWTEDISTRREWRRRGVASALISASLRQLAELGYDEAALGADVDSPTRALQLYESLGYREVERIAIYERPVSAG